MANENMIKFLRGNVANLPQTATAGALYFTKDEGIYMGMEDGSYHRYGDFIIVANTDALPAAGAHETCMYYCTEQNILCRYDSANSKWVQINRQPTVSEMKELLGLKDLAYLSEVAESNLNSDLAAKINAASGAQHTHDNASVLNGITSDKVTAWDSAEQNAKDYADGLNTTMDARVQALEAIDHSHTFVESELNKIVDGDVAKWNTAAEKAHTHSFNETELNKIVEGDVAKWNGVAADHLTSADKTTLENSIKEAKKAGTDANTNIEAYKVTNDARVLAVEEDVAEIVDGTNGILAQAKSYTDGKDSAMNTRVAALEAAAPTHALKSELEAVDAKFANYNTTAVQKGIDDAQDAEIAKKVDKTAYEADKATFATKTELGDVDAKFADYRTSADQDVIDNGHKERIEALEAKFTGDDSVDAKIAAAVAAEAEIARAAEKANADDIDALEGRMDTAEGKIADLEAASATHATKDELNGVDAKFANYKTAADQKAIDDEQDRRLGELEGASATHATKDELAGVDAKFADYTKTSDLPTDLGDFTNNAGYAKTVDVNAELDKKADKSVVEAMYTNSQIDGFIAAEKERAEGIEAGLRTDVDTILGDYLKTEHKTALEGLITAEKERAEGIEGGLRTDVDAIKADYLTSADKTELEGKITAEENRAKGVEESLQTQINTIMNNPDTEGVINSINEFTQYIADHGEIAEGFRADIDKNKEDIAANTKAIEDEVTRATGVEEALGGRIDTLEADYTAHTHSWDNLTDKPFGEGYSNEPSVNVTIETNNTEGDYYKSDMNPNLYFSASEYGTPVKYVFDGVEYYGEYNGMPYGNAYILDSSKTDNGMPFGVKYLSQGFCELYATTPGTHTLQAYESGSVKTLDDKYISSNIARTSDVTALDERVQTLEAIDHEAYVAADAEVLEAAKTAASNQDVVVLAEAQAYTDAAKADAIADAAAKYETKGTAQGIVDGLKLSETYEPIGAESRAIAEAGELDAALKEELQGEINAKANSADVYTKAEVDALFTWGEF